MKEIEGGLTAVPGIRAAAVRAGIKEQGKDLALIVSVPPSEAAGLFTTNRVKAAPVKWSMERIAKNKISAIIANSGNANACTGGKGFADVRTIVSQLSSHLKVPVDSVLMASTGIIGRPMPLEKVTSALPQLVDSLSDQADQNVVEAIMTTDTFPKAVAIEYICENRKIRIAGITKGAGMIQPNMATMLAFLVTDAPIYRDELRSILEEAVEKSFNMITIDGDTSTNDTVICLANGLAKGELIRRESVQGKCLAEALGHVCMKLAQMVVRDGEGATKFVEIRVNKAADRGEAKAIAKAIANSLLVKTAFFGQDPNWGRILSAAGSCGVDFDPNVADLYLGEVRVFSQGLPEKGNWEEQAIQVMRQEAFSVTLCLNSGNNDVSVWTCDLSHDYVRINAAYRT